MLPALLILAAPLLTIAWQRRRLRRLTRLLRAARAEAKLWRERSGRNNDARRAAELKLMNAECGHERELAYTRLRGTAMNRN
jgi:hypothetical protein